MTLNQLRYFTCAARYHSITRAAQEMFVTQPAISTAIRELEKEFSVTLFANTRGRIALTEEGDAFYHRAMEILDSCDALHADYQNRSAIKSKVNIGIPPMLSMVFFPELLEAFHAEHPDVWLVLKEYSSMRACTLVTDELLDAGIINMEDPCTDKFHAHVLSHDELVFCVCPNHPLAALDRLDMEQLDQQNILLFHQDSVQNRILMQRFEHLHIQPRIIMHSSQLMTVLKFLRRGNCGCFLFKSMLPMVPELVSIPLSTPIPVRAGLIWKQGRHLNKGMQCFVDFCREHFPISRARS